MHDLQKIRGLHENLVVETSEGKTSYLLAVGLEPTYIRLSPAAYYLLQQQSLGVSFEECAKALSRTGQQISPAEVKTSYGKVLKQIEQIERSPKIQYSGFLLRQTLIPESIVNVIAFYLAWAFYKPVSYCLLGLIAAAVAITPRNGFLSNLAPTDYLWGYGLFLVSVLIHELGHASACKRYGAQPSKIGCALYLIWPVFYSDVSAAWSLKRWQRVVVDVGGVFFQLVVAAGYVFVYSWTHWSALKLAILIIASNCLFNLNPVFKFDGYWVLADSLGIANLGETRSCLMKHWLNRLRRRPTEPLSWSPTILRMLALYIAVSFAVWGYISWKVLPIFWKNFLEYPSLLRRVVPNLWHWPPTLATGQFQAFLGSTFMVIMLGLVVRRLYKIIFVTIFRRF
jgi:putative peptide zinc metalloprotease protein